MATKKTPRIDCPKCNGTGKVLLDYALEETWNTLNLHGESFVSEVYARLPDRNGFKITAVNNRLEQLRDLGLADRRHFGKRWKYFVVKKGTK